VKERQQPRAQVQHIFKKLQLNYGFQHVNALHCETLRFFSFTFGRSLYVAFLADTQSNRGATVILQIVDEVETSHEFTFE